MSVLPKWEERQLPYHAMAATNHMRGGGEADFTSQQGRIAVRGHRRLGCSSLSQFKEIVHIDTGHTTAPNGGKETSLS